MNENLNAKRFTDRILQVMTEMKVPILSALIAGFASYMFCFVNKLETMDDLAGLYGQAATITSGRWGLDILKYFTPNFSLPWLNGLVSLLLITLSICMIVRMFDIRNTALRILLPAVMISFPSQTCTFGYMFTTVQYAIALTLSVTGAYLLTTGKNTVKTMMAAGILFVFTMSIYQPYIAMAASCLVVYTVFLNLQGKEKPEAVLRCGLRYVLCLVCSLIAYYLVTLILQKVTGNALNEYGSSALGGAGAVLSGIRFAYTSFFGYFIKGYYDLVPTAFSRILHAVAAVMTAILLVRWFLPLKDHEDRKKRGLLLLLSLALLPAAVNCIRIISTLTHNLMLFSVTSVYILTACVIQHTVDGKNKNIKWKNLAKNGIELCMAAVIWINVLYANGVYYKMYMQVEQAESFYTAVISALMQEEGFDSDSQIAFVGSNDVLYPIPMVNTDNLAGIREGIVGTYSQAEFLRSFLGLTVNICDGDVTDALSQDERVISMPSYPYHGCIQNIDGYFVVKLG